jgi:hypothetical protein
LTLEEKVRMLRSWECDATQLAVAEQQGAADGLVQRIL